MTSLGDVLALCPASDAEQRRLLEARYGLRTPADLQGSVVFGTGLLGIALAQSLMEQGLEPAGFSDNDQTRWGDMVNGLTIIPPQELDPERPIVIGSKSVKEIFTGLEEAGSRRLIPHYLLPVLFPGIFPGGFHSLSAEAVAGGRKEIEGTFAGLEDGDSAELFLRLLTFRLTLDPLDLPDPTPSQYFPGGFWRLDDREVFVDAGACGGDTLADFLKRTSGVFAKYFAFEPDPQNLEELRQRAAQLSDPRLVVLPFGVGDRRERVSFLAGRGGESRVEVGGTVGVQLVTLDEVLAAEQVTTIKIDVEGYEREVLWGARRILQERGPKLAVGVYHRLQDLWEIPAFVRRCRGGYRHYLRHHTPEIYDTVLYCVPEVVTGSAAGCEEGAWR